MNQTQREALFLNMLNILQDLGFTVKSCNMFEKGLISFEAVNEEGEDIKFSATIKEKENGETL